LRIFAAPLAEFVNPSVYMAEPCLSNLGAEERSVSRRGWMGCERTLGPQLGVLAGDKG
jgi:hypothetical protein